MCSHVQIKAIPQVPYFLKILSWHTVSHVCAEIEHVHSISNGHLHSYMYRYLAACDSLRSLDLRLSLKKREPEIEAILYHAATFRGCQLQDIEEIWCMYAILWPVITNIKHCVECWMFIIFQSMTSSRTSSLSSQVRHGSCSMDGNTGNE